MMMINFKYSYLEFQISKCMQIQNDMTKTENICGWNGEHKHSISHTDLCTTQEPDDVSNALIGTIDLSGNQYEQHATRVIISILIIPYDDGEMDAF
jgi:hypothetical protein